MFGKKEHCWYFLYCNLICAPYIIIRCISRQLWYGHRIPVWYIGNDSEDKYIVARKEEEAQTKATKAGHPADVILCQEEDSLDTWFSLRF